VSNSLAVESENQRSRLFWVIPRRPRGFSRRSGLGISIPDSNPLRNFQENHRRRIQRVMPSNELHAEHGAASARSRQRALAAIFLSIIGTAGVNAESPVENNNPLLQAFSKYSLRLELLASSAIGVSTFGGHDTHDFWFLSGRVGFPLGQFVSPETPFVRNLELFGALIGGSQYEPNAAYYIGSNCGIRYSFPINDRWVPYLICQAGIAATDIGSPDLSGTFQFNEQGGIGLRYHFEPSRALAIESTLMHISNGGISEPNDGVNAVVLSLGYYFHF
jgi:hypothetical protein